MLCERQLSEPGLQSLTYRGHDWPRALYFRSLFQLPRLARSHHGLQDDRCLLSRDIDRGGIQDLTGQQDLSGGVYWIDPCTSAFLGGSCSGGGSEGLFTLPEPGQLGYLGQSVIFGPRRFLFDFSLGKRTKIGESMNIEFRWEVFNAFNNTNLNTPENNVTDSNFGQITRTVSEPRVMQFALKVNF